MTNRRPEAICGLRIARIRAVDRAHVGSKAETQCDVRLALSQVPLR
jgi:hypothetical protein